jgi:hypothetical protein
VVVAQIHQHGQHATVVARVGREAQLGEDVADMGFDGLRSQPQPLPNPAIGEALGDQAEDFAFAWGQLIGPTLSRWRRRVRKALEQFTSSDPCGHVLGLLAIGRPVLEFDDWILALAAQLLERVALTSTQRSLHDLVLDALLIESLLNLPARMRTDLDPHIRAPMELDRHFILLTESVQTLCISDTAEVPGARPPGRAR